MSDFDAIDALLAAVGPQAELPPPDARRELRERARLSKAQVARTLGVSPSTVGGWENGRDPADEIRTKYAYLLDGLAAKFPSEPEREAEPEEAVESEEPAGPDGSPPSPVSGEYEAGDDVESLTAPEPCVLCGSPARHRVAGFAQHLDPADCRPATAASADADTSTRSTGTGTQPTDPRPNPRLPNPRPPGPSPPGARPSAPSRSSPGRAT